MNMRSMHAVMALLWVAVAGSAVAAPEGGVVVSGSGSIGQDGDKTVVTQHSADLVVDWDSFNVSAGEHVHFEQRRVTDAALNRIYDARPSEIWGRLTSRGSVWLLNPNGVIFGRGSRVSVGNLVAAGLWMDRRDFMQGRYVLNASRGVGDVSNAGDIASGGSVGLFGGNVRNSGSIRARAGRVALAGGERVTVDFAGDGLLRFVTDVALEGAVVDHSGSMEAGEVSLSAGAVGDVFSGVINTTGVVVAVRADGSGGRVSLRAAEINHDGDIDVGGGEVELTAGRELALSGGISARGGGGLGVEHAGGSVRLTADRVRVESTASIDASGAGGGGEVLVGGGWQGADPGIGNAWATDVARGATIFANALGVGDGGMVVVWSDGTTTFRGEIEARGGAAGGDGGLVEVSGRRHLLMRGFADLGAPRGRAGHLLLDPGTVRICAAAAAGCTASGMDTFTDAQIQAMLGSANVTIATSAASSGVEDINVGSGVSIAWSANTLSLNAGNNIDLGGGAFTASGAASLSLSFANLLRLGSSALSGSVSATGAGSSSILEGFARDAAWVINGGSVTIGGVAIAISNIGRLRGGIGADVFAIASFTGDIDGGIGADTFVINAPLTGNLAGGAGSDTFIVSAALTGDMDGGAGDDLFSFRAGADVTGAVDGGGGGDTVRMLAGSRISGSLALGETAEDGSSADMLDMSGYGAATTLVYSEGGGSAYVAGSPVAPGLLRAGLRNVGNPLALIGSDGHGNGASSGMYGAEMVIGAEHDAGAGTGTYLVVQPDDPEASGGGQYARDLVINGASSDPGAVALMLPDLGSFSGPVLLGGSAAPSSVLVGGSDADALPLSLPSSGAEPAVQARRLVIAGEVQVGGSLAVTGSAVLLQADVSTGAGGPGTPAAGDTGIAIIATGRASEVTGVQLEGDGLVSSDLAAGESRRSINSGSALIVAADTFSNADSTTVNLGAGSLQYAQGGAESPTTFGAGSSYVGTEVESEQFISDLGLDVNTELVLADPTNPASALFQTAALSLDTGLFEQAINLFSTVGKGISLYLSMCEQVEGCAPPVSIEEIDSLLQGAKARLAELRQRLGGGEGALAEPVRRLEKAVRDFIRLRQEFLEIFGEGSRIHNRGMHYMEVSVPPWEYMPVAQAGT